MATAKDSTLKTLDSSKSAKLVLNKMDVYNLDHVTLNFDSMDNIWLFVSINSNLAFFFGICEFKIASFLSNSDMSSHNIVYGYYSPMVIITLSW